MTDTALDLTRPRDLNALIGTTFALYRRHLKTFLTIAVVVVVPDGLIVSGIGLGQLTAPYQDDPAVERELFEFLVAALVTTPLITAMHVTAVMDVARGEAPSARRSIAAGLEAFAPVLAAMVMYVLGVIAGFILLIVPGVYLAVRWYFVTQVVVVDGRRGVEVLERSGQLVRGNWWRVLGIAIVFNLIVALLTVPIAAGVQAAAEAADAQAVMLAGTILTQILTLSFLALATTLLYFDLRVRREGPPPFARRPAEEDGLGAESLERPEAPAWAPPRAPRREQSPPSPPGGEPPPSPPGGAPPTGA